VGSIPAKGTMRRFAPFLIVGLILGIAPITGPELPVRIVEYVKPEPPPEVSMIAVGDMMLSRAVAKRMRLHGYDYPFASTSEFLRSADITFGNLETSITPGPEVESFEMSFRADPESAAALRDAGFDVLSLANNHTPNFGETGLQDTMRYLDDVGIVHVGAGLDTQAHQPRFMTEKGIRFAFLAYNDRDVVPASYEASDSRFGTAFMQIERMQAAVRAAKGSADIVIVSMHSGTEYELFPNDSQTAFARAAIDAGAEIVIGHHPHVVQTREMYNGKYIFYSLGNFVFDQMWSQDTRDGLALKIVFTKEGISGISYHATEIHDYAQPRLLESGEHADRIIERLSATP
jgi:poly-gamma-glutamate capsule biosynthesis protein CapA/YwtB (metallophosphatase superfamily)